MNARLQRRSSGLALLAVLVVSMLASMIVISLLYRVRVELLASHAGTAGRQARSAALSGVYHAASVVRNTWADPAKWLDNPAVFRNKLVLDDGRQRWYFTVYATRDGGEDDEDRVRHGVTDESSRWNLHAIPDEILNAIPGMREDQFATLRDHVGSSEIVPTFRAAPYDPAWALGGMNGGRIATLGELSRLEGFETEDTDALTRAAESDGRGYAGEWSRYLTTFGVRRAVDSRGRRQIDLNQDVEPLAALDFPREFFEYVAAVRKASESGVAFTHPSALLDAQTTVKNAEDDEVEIHSGIGLEHLDELLDRCTTVPFDRFVEPTININTASAAVLELAPGIDETLAKTIAATRGELSAERRQTTAWLLGKGLLSAEDFREAAPYLTARGFQYRVKVIGYGVPSGVYRVLEAVVDVSEPKTRVLFLRDCTRDGLPFPIRRSEVKEASRS